MLDKDLTVIEYQNKRVLTTQQLAQAYETEPSNITKNYHVNKDRFTAGKDFHLLQGNDLQEFKRLLTGSNDPLNLKFVSQLMLWTDRGANRHSKILDTDKAWQQFDLLEDTYFNVKNDIPVVRELSPQLQVLINMELRQKEIESRQNILESRIDAVKETIIQRDDNWRECINEKLNKIGKIKGDYQQIRADSYRSLEERAGCDLNTRQRNLKQRLLNSGATKTKIDSVTKIDVIESDKRLKEIYTTITKEMVIKHLA